MHGSPSSVFSTDRSYHLHKRRTCYEKSLVNVSNHALWLLDADPNRHPMAFQPEQVLKFHISDTYVENTRLHGDRWSLALFGSLHGKAGQLLNDLGHHDFESHFPERLAGTMRSFFDIRDTQHAVIATNYRYQLYYSSKRRSTAARDQCTALRPGSHAIAASGPTHGVGSDGPGGRP